MFHQPPLFGRNGHRLHRTPASTTYGPDIERCIAETQRRFPSYPRSWIIADALAHFFGVRHGHVSFSEARSQKGRGKRR